MTAAARHAGTGADVYGQARRATASPRAIEYAAFSRVTGQLTAAEAAPGEMTRLAAALHDNNRLWMALAADLAGPENRYPDALRGQLISLGAFVLRHSRQVLAGEATLRPLIDVNMAVMRGLRGAEAA
ncbi:MAG: flagellar biosynthesis regulator FlaF [Pseudomonadota bacterium]